MTLFQYSSITFSTRLSFLRHAQISLISITTLELLRLVLVPMRACCVRSSMV
uniref:Uncharacterized protein n=1 Tax=Arundo donax TaxID=35708 RepID=A0A0A9CIZ7_ARUDO